MTQTLYGWIVLKKDGTPWRHKKTNALAIFQERSLAMRLATELGDGSRAVSCTIAVDKASGNTCKVDARRLAPAATYSCARAANDCERHGDTKETIHVTPRKINMPRLTLSVYNLQKQLDIKASPRQEGARLDLSQVEDISLRRA